MFEQAFVAQDLHDGFFDGNLVVAGSLVCLNHGADPDSLEKLKNFFLKR
jgi:hypothetical protein